MQESRRSERAQNVRWSGRSKDTKTTSKFNNILPCQTSSKLKLPQSTVQNSITKGDSGATNHYFGIKSTFLLNVSPDPNGPTVTLPNNQTIRATHQGDLPFVTHLSPQATKTSLFPNLHNNLLSIGPMTTVVQ